MVAYQKSLSNWKQPPKNINMNCFLNGDMTRDTPVDSHQRAESKKPCRLASLYRNLYKSFVTTAIPFVIAGCTMARPYQATINQLPATPKLSATITYTPRPTATFTKTPTPTKTASPTITPTKKLYTIEGMLFEDKDYDGIQDEAEMPITGVEICVYARDCVPVDEDGRFKVVYDKEIAPVNLKQPKLEDGTVKYNIRLINDGQKIIPAFENIPEQKLDIIHRSPASYGMKVNANSPNKIALVQDKEIKGLCPVDISARGVSLTSRFGVLYKSGPFKGKTHEGIDIAGKHGTMHIVPENGSSIILGRDNIGGLKFYYSMENGRILFMTHFDFSFNNYATLRFFGLDPSLFYDSDGNLKNQRNKEWKATQNTQIWQGQILPLYMGMTGEGNYFVHTHIGIKSLGTYINPCLYLDCCGN